MSLHRGFDGSAPSEPDPVRGGSRWNEERRDTRTTRLASGTLACPDCDAPVAAPERPAPVTAAFGCPYCGRDGTVRDFLSLGEPTRPTRVAVHVRAPVVRRARVARPR